jgi:RHS repeat-associated protein
MMMPGRTYSATTGYRYGFNGKENDNEVKGEGNQQDYGMRVYDPRLGRFLSVDPLAIHYPYYTPYSYAGNKPIACIDLDGGEEKYKVTTDFRIQYKPVFSSPNAGTAADNAMHNTMTFIWNTTAGSALEAGKGAWNTTAATVTGNYQPSSWEVDPVGAFMDWTTDAWNYVFHTSAKQKAKDFVNTATNPATYELPAQLIIAHKIAAPELNQLKPYTVTADMSLTQRMVARQNFAQSFYERSGFAASKALEHMEGIDFTKSVQTTILKKGTVIQQWVGENGVGNYFTNLENGSAKNLGINYEGRTLKQYTLTEDVEVLQSTAREYKGHAGGGSQYFSTALKNKVSEVKNP